MSAAPVRYRIKGSKVYVEPVQRARASLGGYEAASTATRMAKWKINAGGPNATMGPSLPNLRGRSRDMARQNGVADHGLEVLVSNIVGTGIKPQFVTRNAELNKSLASLWLRWTDESDADGRFDFYGQQALACRSMLEAGDVFARLRARRPEDGLSVPLQIQLLESEFCPVEKNETISPGRTIQNGVEFDAIGRRTAYWLYRDHPLDGTVRQRGTAMAQPVPASEVVHLAYARRPGMIRGEPWLARALVKLYELDQYDDAQLTRQKLAAMFAGFMTPSAEGKFGFQEDADSGGVSLAALEPGTMQVLEPGASMTFTTPPSPGDSYEMFMRQQHRHVAGSMGILYEQLTGDFSQVNDRTWRAAMNEFKRGLERWQHSLLVFQFCRPIIARWAEYGVLSGAIKLVDGVTVGDVARPKWIPQAQAYINPVQDVQARRDEVRSGFRSRAEIVSERGYDVEALDAEIAADNKRADDNDLRFDSDGRTDLKGGAPGDAVAADAAANDPNNPANQITAALEHQLTASLASSLKGSGPRADDGMVKAVIANMESFGASLKVLAEKPPPRIPAPVVHVAPAVVNVEPAIINYTPPKTRKVTNVKHDTKGRIVQTVTSEE